MLEARTPICRLAVVMRSSSASDSSSVFDATSVEDPRFMAVPAVLWRKVTVWPPELITEPSSTAMLSPMNVSSTPESSRRAPFTRTSTAFVPLDFPSTVRLAVPVVVICDPKLNCKP